jgi:alpha-2-macroglobulin
MTKTLLRLVILFAIAVGLSGQRDDAAYFSLSSSGTFGSGGVPSVSLNAWNVDSLEFRVYRIKDPEKFFGQLEDPHEFGGMASRPPHTRSALENIRSWKRGLKAHIRRSLRAQFTESPSAHFESLFPAEKTPATTGATQFAEVPLLNPQQLAMSFRRPVSAKSRWERQTVSVPVKERGVYLVEAVSNDLRAYTILMVSDLALITKTANGRSVNFLVDRASGQPVAGSTITAVSKFGANAHAETDRDGIAELKIAPQDGAVTIIASAKGDVAVNSVEGRESNRDWTGYVYTDRPVYRPGHTVHFKALLRERTAEGYRVPDGKQVSVEIQDAEQKPVYQKTVTVGANGAIHDDLILGPAASLGSYFIQVKAGDDNFMSGNFEVQEYKKPEYEVRVIPSKNRVLEGATVPVVVDAQYFFGEPVSGAKVKYRVYRQPYWFPFWYDSDEDRESDDGSDGATDSNDSDDSGGDQQNEQQGQLDANGKLTINVPTAVSEHNADFVYRVEVGVTDAANREISGTGWIVATYGSFVLNATPERYVYAPGDHATFTLQARDYDNKPVQTRAHVELLRQNRRGEPTSVAATDAALDASGSAKVTLQIPRQGGEFLVRVTAPSAQGRNVQATTYVWVDGGGWDMDVRNQTVEMITDKKTYRAGDTAKLMIVAGKPGTAVYVTVEGRDIGQYKMLRATESTVTFEVPVTVKDEPGITVNAVFVRDGVFYRGDKYVHVPPVEHTLKVKVSTDKPQYQPGQTADYAIDVTDGAGKPVPRADFSLGVVDEAIYGVRKDTTQDILSFFYSRDYNRVPTESSLNYFFNGEAGKRRMQLAELRPRSRLAQLKPDRLVQPKVRKAFPDTAFWAADLTTDDAGHARAKIDFPDSLTTWRATARGITASTMVGSATLKTIVRKNLIVRLAAPRFFVRGDEVVIPVIVHNYLESAKTAHVSLDVKGLDVLDGATKDVLIPSRGEATVNWRVRAQQTRGVTLTAKALTNEESDALEIELPVNFAGVKLSQSKGGSMSAGGTTGSSASFDITFPDKIEPGSRSLSIRVSPSIAGALFGALDYLTSFPYGCVEQTMSSFLPNIVVKDALHGLNLKADLDEAALQEKIHAGLDRLYSFQHEDGGWGWWETDDSHPFMTAYVVAGLVQARMGGTQVRQDVIDRGAAWLKKEFAADPKLAADLRAYIVYSLAVAGQADGAALNQVNDKRSDLSPYGLALLGLAFEQMNDSRAGSVADAVIARAQQDSEQAWWPANRDPMLDFDIDATPEATAFVTRFLSHERKDSPLLPKAALWLMNHRNEGEWWDSTKQTAMVIYGLTDYLKVTNELTPNLTGTIYVNDKAVLTRRITEATALNPPDLMLDESALQPGVNHIRVTSSGDGRLYYSVRAEYYSNEPRFEKTGTTSLNLLRDYFRLAPAKDGDRIVYDTVPLGNSVAVGDLIAVRLTVTGSEWKYMMVEDPIPAGTEFVERDNLYELRNKPPWWEYSFTRRELHDDRMAIFQTYFPQGQQQYFYLLKVVNPGAFQVSPARVAPMYQPAVMATTESRRLEVK